MNENMKDRIKLIRSTLNLTQQEFADRLGIKRGGIANYEIGRNDPSDSVISLICREFNVNESWLRTGEGEMMNSPAATTTEVQYSKQAIKFLQKQDPLTRMRITNAINALPAGDVKKLQKRSGYRLRVGNYRVIFDKMGHILYIEKIDNRGQVYKK